MKKKEGSHYRIHKCILFTATIILRIDAELLISQKADILGKMDQKSINYGFEWTITNCTRYLKDDSCAMNYESVKINDQIQSFRLLMTNDSIKGNKNII